MEGSGTVTSVALTVPAALSVSGSPITTSGTLAITGAGSTAQYIDGTGCATNYTTRECYNCNGYGSHCFKRWGYARYIVSGYRRNTRKLYEHRYNGRCKG